MTRKLRKVLTGSVLFSAVAAFGACSQADVSTAAPTASTAEAADALRNVQPEAPVVQVAQAAPTSITERADVLLQKYVQDPDSQGVARFAYGKLAANQADVATLDAYIAHLEGTSTAGMSTNEALAYYSNLYNSVTVKLIIDNYPLKSIKKLGFTGPWDRKIINKDGAKISLNDIEHGTMRKKYPSPYVHYMVNCASIGCPNLKDGLWNPATVEADRQKAADVFVNSPRGVQVTSKGLKVSSIYKWFKDDFGGSKENVLKHIRKHADADLAAAIDGGATITSYGYDWNLNE